MNAANIHARLEAWDAVGHLPMCDRSAIEATEQLTDSVTAALLAIEGVDDAWFEFGSAGSTYWTVEAGDDSWTVRASNHKAGKRACENLADIVVGDSISEIERQLSKVADAVRMVSCG